MLKILVLATTILMVTARHTRVNPFEAKPCSPESCSLPNCKCASTNAPDNLKIEQIPQFVFLTFDDAVEANNYEMYARLFYNRTNPDGCPISATFFTSHEYTDYSKVHDLYVHGHEISLHSISHTPYTDYWKSISLEDLTREFGDEKILISSFANIPEDTLQGMRLPLLQLSGDNSFEVAKEIGLTYDCSWPTQTFRNPGLWPYTLDYKSIQDCPVEPCPTGSIPGVWVVPMIEWTDNDNRVCSMQDACTNIPGDVEGLLEWFKDNFNVQYHGNKAPFGFFLHSAYFADPVKLEAYHKFVDYLQELDDVFLVGPSQAIKWIQNPVSLGSSDWSKCRTVEDLGCEPSTCTLQKDDEIRYMTVCGECPDVFPWLGNPLGKK